MNIAKIKPAFHSVDNTVAVAFTSSDYYAPYLSVVLLSLAKHSSKETNYDIIVFTKDMSDKNKTYITNLISSDNISLRFYDVSNIFDEKKLFVPDYVPVETYFRIIAPEIFLEYSKILFCDSDILIRADIKQLYDMDIEGYPLAAAEELLVQSVFIRAKQDFQGFLKTLNLNDPRRYFQAGIVLFNCKYFKEHDFTQRLLKNIEAKKYKMVDQDALNEICGNHFILLNSEWNYPPLSPKTKQFTDYLPKEIKEKIEGLGEPKIVHFVGAYWKPWLIKENMYDFEWWDLADTTEYRDEIIKRMQDFTIKGPQKLFSPVHADTFFKLIDKDIYDSFPIKKTYDKAICLSCSDEYVPLISVFLNSFRMNNKKKCDIIILTKDMSKKNINIIKKSFSDLFIRVFNISDITENNHFYTYAHFTENTYYRLLIPYILSDYKRVIYFDSDIVINGDISMLFDINLDNYCIAACRDTHVISYCYMRENMFEQYRKDTKEYINNELEIDNVDEYFQAGVVVFNIDMINKKYNSKEFFTEASKTNFRYLDQDFMNKTFYKNVLLLPNKYNVMTINKWPYIDEYFLPDSLRDEYIDSRNDPVCIHYIGKSMPCYGIDTDMAEIFWLYARNTPFYEQLLKIMARNQSHLYFSNINKIKNALLELQVIKKNQYGFIITYIKYHIYKFKYMKLHKEKYKEKYLQMQHIVTTIRNWR